MNEAVQLISTVGFPIVAAGALFWYIIKEQRDLRSSYKEDIDKLSSVVDSNTQVMLQILEHMRKEDADGEEDIHR